jgi:hypothetical protein
MFKYRSLAAENPRLARQWHPKRNGALTPKDVTLKSNRKVWWVCKKGHEWEAIIQARSNGTGCPYCFGRMPRQDTCLETVDPVLASEWHPVRNFPLTPRDVTKCSTKKVWWMCKRGHEWQTRVQARRAGNGCPKCANIIATDEYCLATVKPEVCKQWHPTRNKGISPRDLAPYSGKKVWWRCEKGHEWRGVVSYRSRGGGCPYCYGMYATEENCLQNSNPSLALQWHPDRNGSLTPRDVTPYSHKKVWWRCKKEHEWEAQVGSRSNGSGCPHCDRLKRQRSKSQG